MDNVTHGLAGLLLADATVAAVERRTGIPASRGFRRTAVLIGIIAAELPDADLVYSGAVLGIGKLGYLLHHRGHTHTVVFAVVLALLLWGTALLVRRDARSVHERTPLLLLALAGTLSHLLLDLTNSYGVHPFWPLDNRWFYGDAVFIVEPWLWVAAIPPLLFGPRRLIGKGVLTAALLGILTAAWYVEMVPGDVSMVLSVGALLWMSVMRFAPARLRLPLGATAWLAVTVTGFVASGIARSTIEAAAIPGTLLDAVLTPTVANPLCVSALVIERDGATYRVSNAMVAVWPRVRTARTCAEAARALESSLAPNAEIGDRWRVATRETTAAIAWRQSWDAPEAELVALARSRCDVRAALEFIRAPAWGRDRTGAIRLSDLRFGFGGNGFADLTFGATLGECPAYVPGWTPPRADVIGD